MPADSRISSTRAVGGAGRSLFLPLHSFLTRGITAHRRLFLVALISSFFASILNAATVTVDKAKRQLLVDGVPFILKGVNYSPTRAGGFPGSYNVFADSETYVGDFKLIQLLGANTIRFFDASGATTQALDEAKNRGFYVVMGYSVNANWDLSVASTQTALLTGFTDMVRQFKDHPAVLMWAFGNEVTSQNNFILTSVDAARFYALLDQAAAQAKAIDPNHPVTTALADMGDLGEIGLNTNGDNPTNVDLWGLNVYRASFGNQFTGNPFSYDARTQKPAWLSEFGSDAYNTALAQEDQNTQATDLRRQWSEIADNLSAEVPGAMVVGGSVFEWSDEWWKGRASTSAAFGSGGVNGVLVQDTAVDWTSGSYLDSGIQEEWWGITAISTGSSTKRLRQGFYALKELWNPSPTSSGPLFQGDVTNYPNPLVAGGSTQIRFTLFEEAESVKIDLFDAARRKVASLPASAAGAAVYAAPWNGSDENGDLLPPGLYIARVEVTSNSRSEIKYRRLMIVR